MPEWGKIVIEAVVEEFELSILVVDRQMCCIYYMKQANITNLAILSSFVIVLKSVDRLKIGLDQLLTIFPAITLFSLNSFGCLYRYITAFPIPDSFNLKVMVLIYLRLKEHELSNL